MRTWMVLLLSILLSCCGWHLRGAIKLPESVQAINITPHEPYKPLQRSLRLVLRISGVKVLEDIQTDLPTLHLGEEKVETNPATIGIDGEVKENNVSYSISFSMTDKNGKLIIPDQTISLSKKSFYDANQQLLNSRQSQDRLEIELRDEAINQMLRRIARTLSHNADDYEYDIPEEKAPVK